MVSTPREQRRLARDYRERNVVERCIGWFEECLRATTRYEKLAVHHAGFGKLAMIQRLLRIV